MNHYFNATKARERGRETEAKNGDLRKETLLCIHGVSVQMHCIHALWVCASYIHSYIRTELFVGGYCTCDVRWMDPVCMCVRMYVEVIKPLPGESIVLGGLELTAKTDCGKRLRNRIIDSVHTFYTVWTVWCKVRYSCHARSRT